MPVNMPDPQVPSDATGTDANREAHMVDIDFGPWTLLDEKIADPNSVGTAGDETGIAAEIIRRQRRGNQGY